MKKRTAGAGAFGRISVIRQEQLADSKTAFFLHWPVQLFLESRFLELAMRLQPIGQAGPTR